MGDSGHDLPAASCRKISKEGGNNLPGDVRKGVSVKEQKWSTTMVLPKKFYEFGEREDLLSFFFPLATARLLSLSIKAVLRASSCARSLVVADDRLPTPVFDKSGSGL
jgi:hypothetical protein